MYPIPIFSILTDSGVVPIPEGSVKKVVVSAYRPSTTDYYSVALLLDDGRLFTQGQNMYGEIGDGSTTPRFNTFYLSNLNVTDVFSLPGCFVVKYNSGGWQYIGDNYAFLGGNHSALSTWTSLPSSITGTVTLANLARVSGGIGNALWEMTNGQLYGSGGNVSGCLGSGNNNSISTPRSISTVAVRTRGCQAMVSYVNNAGALRSCGFTELLNGSPQTVMSFGTANLATPVGETVYVRDFMTFSTTTIVIGAPTIDTAKSYLYQRKITTSNYGKYTTGIWANGFDTYSIPAGNQNTFFIADNKLYALGQSRAVCGIDTVGQVVTVPTEPTKIESTWVLSDISYIEQVGVPTSDFTTGHFMVYRGNLFYTGNVQNLFGATSTGVFTQVPENSFTGTTATSITTDSIGIALVGATKQLTYQVAPIGAPIYQPKYTSSDTSKMTVDANGLMTFVAEGGFDAGMTALNNLGVTLSDSSGGYASTLSVYTESLNSMMEGTTQQLVATVSPEGAATLPGMVLTYTTTDATIATVDANGLITSIKPGDCRIGCTATYQGTVTASDSSYLAVTAVPMDIDLTQAALPTGVSGAAVNTSYYRQSGNTLALEANTTAASLEYIGTVPQGRRIVMNAYEQRVGFNTVIPSNTNWIKTNATVSFLGLASPLGTTSNVVKVAPSTTSASHSLSYSYNITSQLLQGMVYTQSVFMKASGLTKVKLRTKGSSFTQDITVDLTTGTITGTGGRILDMGNGWYRVMSTVTLPTSQLYLDLHVVPLNAAGAEVFAGNNTDGIAIWLPQMTPSAFATEPRMITSATTGYGSTSLTIPRGTHTGVDVYFTNGQVVRVPFTGTGTSFTLPTDMTQPGDWGAVFIKGMRYYE